MAFAALRRPSDVAPHDGAADPTLDERTPEGPMRLRSAVCPAKSPKPLLAAYCFEAPTASAAALTPAKVASPSSRRHASFAAAEADAVA